MRFPEIISKIKVFDGYPWLSLYSEQLLLEDGRVIDDYYTLEPMKNWVVVLGLTIDDKVILIKQYRHALKSETLVLPSGGIEKNESPLFAAVREFFEETGYISSNWKFQGSKYLNETYGGGIVYFYIARDVEKVSEPQPEELEGLPVVFEIPITDVLTLISNNKINSLQSITLLLAVMCTSGPVFIGEVKESREDA